MADTKKPVYKTADEARAAYIANNTAYKSLSPAGTPPTSTWWTNAQDPYIQFLSVSSDPINGPAAFQKLYTGLVKQPAPAGTKANNMFEYLQTLLRGTKFSTGKTALGIPDTADSTGLAQALQGAISGGASDVFSYLGAITAFGGRGGTGKTVKQIDTTTKYSAQITKALKFKDYGDAKNALVDNYFLAFGVAPDEELIGKFQAAWNKEQTAQTASTRSDFKTKYEPVYTKNPIYDKSKPVLTKSGKVKKDAKGNTVYQQKLDKDGKPMFEQLKNKEGVLQFKPITTTVTEEGGEGFTESEQQQWLADFMVNNYPTANFNPEKIGGAAKVVYDELIKTNRENYVNVPSFATLAPIITQVLKSGNPQVGAEVISAYQAQVRAQTAKRFMAFGEDINAGANAKQFIEPILEKLSIGLERPVALNDPFAQMVFNYKSPEGTYRQPNEYELTQLIINHQDFSKTSTSKNQAVNLFQSLKSGIGR